MKAILSTLLLLGTSSVALARPDAHRQAPVVREHRVETRHPWPERDHRGGYNPGNRGGYHSVDPGYRFDRRWERPRNDYRWYGRGPVVVRPWVSTTTVVADNTTFVDQVVVTYDDGRVQTLAVGRYLDPANIAYELGIDRDCARQITVYGRDGYGRSITFAA